MICPVEWMIDVVNFVIATNLWQSRNFPLTLYAVYFFLQYRLENFDILKWSALKVASYMYFECVCVDFCKCGIILLRRYVMCLINLFTYLGCQMTQNTNNKDNFEGHCLYFLAYLKLQNLMKWFYSIIIYYVFKKWLFTYLLFMVSERHFHPKRIFLHKFLEDTRRVFVMEKSTPLC